MCFRFGLFVARAYLAAQNSLLALVTFVLFRPDTEIEPDSILVYRTARLGDFIVAIPALAVLRRRFPSARIVLLTTSSTAQNMQTVTQTYTGNGSSLPWLSLVVPALVDEAIVLPMGSWRAGLEEARQCIGALNPDAVFVLPFSSEDGVNRLKKMLFLRLAGATGPVYGRRIHSTTRLLREAQYRAGMFEHQVWGPLRAVMECSLVPLVEERDVTFPLTIDSEAECWRQQLWERQGWFGKRIVAIFPGGMFPHKRWPWEKFAEVCRTLQAKYDVVFVLLGASTDREFCDRVSTTLETGISLNLAGQTSMMQLAALLRRCILFVGNDSGPVHLASALGCPSTTLTSSIVYPGWWEPWNSRAFALRHRVACQYCFSHTHCPLETNECIKEIGVEEVIATCKALLSHPSLSV